MILAPENYLRDSGDRASCEWALELDHPAWSRLLSDLERALGRRDVSRLIVLVGLPSSGKSTWALCHLKSDEVCIDATNTLASRRQAFIEIAKRSKTRIEAVVLLTEFRLCAARNLRRSEGRVSHEDMCRLHNQLSEQPVRIEEGFQRISFNMTNWSENGCESRISI